MVNKHFGFMMSVGNRYFFLETDRKRVTDAVAILFIKEILLHQNRAKVWENATEKERSTTIAHAKYSIQPVMFEVKTTSTGVKYFSYNTLRTAQNETTSCGGGTLPEKYWEEELDVFTEKDFMVRINKEV